MVEVANVEEFRTFISNSGLNSEDYIFRGQACETWYIWPSVFRIRARYQVLFFENTAKFVHDNNKTGKFIEFLAFLQHYNPQTRLLDFSTNPLVALYFACSDQDNENAAVYCLPKKIVPDHSDGLEQGNSEILFVKLQNENPRLKAQSGCFLLWPMSGLKGNNSDDAWYSFTLKQYLKFYNLKENLTTIIIKKEHKSNILKELANQKIDRDNIYVNYHQNNKVLEKMANEVFRICSESTEYMTGPVNNDLLKPNPHFPE